MSDLLDQQTAHVLFGRCRQDIEQPVVISMPRLLRGISTTNRVKIIAIIAGDKHIKDR